ncbi:MAG: VOC family protein [Gemmatimonadota bacterium]
MKESREDSVGADENAESTRRGVGPKAWERRKFVRTLFGGVGAVGVSGAALDSPDPRQVSPIGRLDHAAIPIRNVDEMIAFYRAFGFEVRDGDSIVSIHFRDQKINFHRPALWREDSFNLRASAARPPCGDFCWIWEGTDAALRERLDRAGAEVVAEGEREGGRDGGRAVGRSVYTRDPDGNLLEFIRY